ncbi:MAG: hypothetical protein WBP56_20585 [Polyangia bacterium]
MAKKAVAKQIAVRLDAETLRRLDLLAKKLERPGLPVSRTGALRAALAQGIEVLEKQG